MKALLLVDSEAVQNILGKREHVYGLLLWSLSLQCDRHNPITGHPPIDLVYC